MLEILKGLVRSTWVEPLLRTILNKPKIEFTSSADYWETRYALNGNSGAGSYGRMASFKASIINEFVKTNDINTVVEFGCGDGNQLTQANYPNYLGIDVSRKAIELCKNRFKDDMSKSFCHIDDVNNPKAELSMSLDVIYHLVEDAVYNKYMTDLFCASERYVCIYSSDYVDELSDEAEHIRHRMFTEWVKKNAPQFELISKIPNIYPYDKADPKNTTYADFFFFKRI